MKYFHQLKINLRENISTIFNGALTCGLSIVILGFFLLAYINFFHVAEKAFEVRQYSVIIDAKSSSEEIAHLASIIDEMPGVSGVKRVNTEEIRQGLIDSIGKNINDELRTLTKQFLPIVFEFNLEKKTDVHKELFRALEVNERVVALTTPKDQSEKIVTFFLILDILGGSFLSILCFSIFLICGNVIMIAIYNHIKEVELLRRLGASFWFIGTPYFFEGIIVTSLGYFGAIGFIYIVYRLVLSAVDSKIGLELAKIIIFYSPEQLLIGLGLIVGIGLISSLISCFKVLQKVKI